MVDISFVVVFCLILNLFIGSGFFDMVFMEKSKRLVWVGFGIDVGGGISYFML